MLEDNYYEAIDGLQMSCENRREMNSRKAEWHHSLSTTRSHTTHAIYVQQGTLERSSMVIIGSKYHSVVLTKALRE